MSAAFRTFRRFLVKISPAFFPSRNNLYADFTSNHVKNSVSQTSIKLLDAGGSEGNLTFLCSKRLQAEGFSVFSVVFDESLDALRAGKRRHGELQFVRGDAAHVPFTVNSFDVVVSFSLFEHLGNPMSAVRELANVSNNGLIVQIPNLRYFIEPHTKAPFLYLFPTSARNKIVKLTIPWHLNFDVSCRSLIDWFNQVDFGLLDALNVYHAQLDKGA